MVWYAENYKITVTYKQSTIQQKRLTFRKLCKALDSERAGFLRLGMNSEGSGGNVLSRLCTRQN